MNPDLRISLRFVVPTLIAALALSIVPLPAALNAYRPDWVALTVVYWVLAMPQRFSLGMAWLTGVTVDALNGTLLGQHALALTVLAFLAIRFRLRLRVFPVWQQTLTVVIMIAVHEFILLWIDGLTGELTGSAMRWASTLSNLAVWPALTVSLNRLRGVAPVR